MIILVALKVSEYRKENIHNLNFYSFILIITPTELNTSLVKLLITRDELYMEQDSLLVDIEDLTKFL